MVMVSSLKLWSVKEERRKEPEKATRELLEAVQRAVGVAQSSFTRCSATAAPGAVGEELHRLREARRILRRPASTLSRQLAKLHEQLPVIPVALTDLLFILLALSLYSIRMLTNLAEPLDSCPNTEEGRCPLLHTIITRIFIHRRPRIHCHRPHRRLLLDRYLRRVPIRRLRPRHWRD